MANRTFGIIHDLAETERRIRYHLQSAANWLHHIKQADESVSTEQLKAFAENAAKCIKEVIGD